MTFTGTPFPSFFNKSFPDIIIVIICGPADSPLKLSLSSVSPEDANSKRAELVSSSRAVLSQNREDPIAPGPSEKGQQQKDDKKNRMSGSFVRPAPRTRSPIHIGEKCVSFPFPFSFLINSIMGI
jgi:hypothetical protein